MASSNRRIVATPNDSGISPSRRIAEELEQQREWYDVTLSSIGDGVISADMQGKVTFLNPVAESLTGWSNEEAQGRPLEDVFRIISEDTRTPIENPALRAMREGVISGLENHTLLISRDGREISIDDSGSPIRTGDGVFLGAVLVFRDITERRRGDEARALLVGIVDSSEDAIISKNLDGVIMSWNIAAERMFEYSAAEAIGQHITLIIPPERHHEETVILGRLRQGQRIEHFETVRVSKRGRRINISLSVSPVRNNRGEIIGASKIARDITERVRADQERARLLGVEQSARERAEAANRAKDEFVAMISHEIRSPLNSVLGWSQLIRRGSLDKDAMDRALESIERNARAQVQLLGDLLDISRVVTGKLRIETRPIDVRTTLEAALESIRPAAEAKSITVDVYPGPAGNLVTGDADRLQQVFWNLLSNAVKFTPNRGHIRVEIRRLDSYIQIKVSDSGIGISEEFLPYVFDRFTQADTSTVRKHMGLGLGLAIVRHLIELHGGSVAVESAGEGQGATFTVTLPVRVVRDHALDFGRAGSAVPSLDTKTEKIPLAGLRVMIVDDEIEARELLTAILSTQGAEVKACKSTAEALAVIEEWKPALLVSDISMPEEDGYSFIKRVRMLDSEQRDVPAIALTAYARSEDRMRALAAGFQMHVPKPVEAMELLMVVTSLAKRLRREVK
jgi:PAS domain S-box-containing protein